MEIIKTIYDLKEKVKTAKHKNKTIGFVPTMGYLHKGHLSLVKKTVEQNDFNVVSIFVNPNQFSPDEDYEEYPRNLSKDAKMVKSIGANIIFAPSVKEMYPEKFNTYVQVEGNITKTLCGQSRPTHFKGVTTIVLKLFNLVQPDKAYFGQKDAQQVAVIKKMVKDLNIDTEIISCPIIREKDGLALSSRNTYLSREERNIAPILYKSLIAAKKMINNGEKNSSNVRRFIVNNINTQPNTNIDYVSIVNAETLEPLKQIQGNILIALAVKLGKTRLIDNIQLEVY